MTVRPFRIHVVPEVLDDLRARLSRTRWREASADDTWQRGTNAHDLRDLVGYWATEFDWRERERHLNALPHFMARAHGIDVHFVHKRATGLRPMPLLLLHGWPDSFYRYDKVVQRLAGAGYDVVVPSLPGFGFTGPVELPRIHPNRHTAEMLWHLMTEVLGYSRFAVAGGDGGSVLAQLIAIDHPESVIGVHLTDLGWHAANIDRHSANRAEHKYLAGTTKRFMTDGAYAAVQSTRPRSLAPALADSPVGLASWILDRFHAWSEGTFELDDLLTNIMIYWVTNTIESSMLTYVADRRSTSLTTAERVERPVGLALFPAEAGGIPPRRLAERTLNVVRWTEMPRGGHFAALEEPELWADEVDEFFRTLRAEIRATSRHDVHAGAWS